jgi:uncharacterized membrane protein
MDFFRYCALFFIGGIIGWIIELFFRRFVSQHKWVNPGFLTGPILPLYGFGLAVLYFLASVSYDWIGPVWAQEIVKIVFIGIAMTLAELIAGLIFIDGMKIKLWDYSERWGNYKGIICPLFSLIWTVFGAVYVFLLHPLFRQMTDAMLSNAWPFLFTLGFAFGILSIDIAYSFQLVVKIRKAVAEKKLVVDWDKLKASFQETRHKLKQRAPWLFAFRASSDEFKSMVDEYKGKLASDMGDYIAKLNARKALREAKNREKAERKAAKKRNK